MFVLFTSNCIAPKYDSDTRVSSTTCVHLLAFVADLLIGITALVVGILSLTCPSMGISLSTGLQGALIGGATVYTGVTLSFILAMIKYNSRFANKFLNGTIGDRISHNE